MSVLVVVLVFANGAPPPVTMQRLTESAESALGVDATVVARVVAAGTDERSVLGDPVKPTAVASLTCQTTSCDVVRLRVKRPDATRVQERTFTFASTDAPAERGRTIGFALAAMSVPTSTSAPVLAEGSSPSAKSDSTAISEPSKKDGADHTAGPTTNATSPAKPRVESGDSAVPRDGSISAPRASTQARMPLLRMSLGFEGAVGVGGSALGGGGQLRVGVWVSPEIHLEIATAARVGPIDAAHANSTTYLFGGGVAWTAVHAGKFQLDAAVDAAALATSVELRDRPDSATRWVPAARVTLEPAVALASWFDVYAASGVEVAFGTTRILVGDAAVASVPPLRVILSAGVRASF